MNPSTVDALANFEQWLADALRDVQRARLEFEARLATALAEERIEPDNNRAQTDQLASIMKSIGQLKEGNVLAFDYVDGGTRVSINGAAKGTIPGEAFNKALFNAWLGDKPVQDDLKKAMLGS